MRSCLGIGRGGNGIVDERERVGSHSPRERPMGMPSCPPSCTSTPPTATPRATAGPAGSTAGNIAGPVGSNAGIVAHSFGSGSGRRLLWNSKAKRQAVTGPSSEPLGAADVPVVQKPPATRNYLREAIRDHLLFQDLPEAALEVIIDSMSCIHVSAGADIIKQGDTIAHQFFIVEQGSCEVWVQGKAGYHAGKPALVSTYGPGDSFGELALLYNAPRAATVRAASRCQLWIMERSILNTVKRNFTEASSKARHQLLEKVPGLKNLPPHQRAQLVDALKKVEFSPRRTVFHKGSPGNEFYIIKEGTARVQDDGQLLAHLGPGSYFGERALLGAEVRAADVVAGSNKLVCYRLDREDFTSLLGSSDELWRFEAIQQVPLLYNLPEHKKWQMARAMQTELVSPGQVIFRKGDAGDKFYIIQEGVFACLNENGQDLALITEGSCFGELALLSRDQGARAATVVCRSGSGSGSSSGKLLSLSREQFSTLLGNLVQLRHVWRFEALRRVPLLCELEPEAMGRLAGALVQTRFKTGDDIIVEGDRADRFYIVEHGRLGVYKSRPQPRCPAASSAAPTSRQAAATAFVSSAGGGSAGGNVGTQSEVLAGSKKLLHLQQQQQGASSPGSPGPRERPILVYQAGNYFGELALLRDEPRAATVRALSPGSLLTVDRQHFHSLMGPLLPQMMRRAQTYAACSIIRVGKEVDLKYVKVLATLGAGGFGQVLLVDYMSDKFALKCIKKSFVEEQGLVEHVRREKAAMLQADNPFLVKLKGTTQDSEHLYMMMEAVMGGELFGYLQTCKAPLSESHARFYAASVVMGLEYLHDRNMVYRDLKPENLLIDLQGYVKMTDFGFVKKVEPGTKTYTLCGTPEYLAPEIIMNKGHNHAADWWALGVLIYELCSGIPPFMHEDRLVMFRRICQHDLVIPKTFTNSLRNLVEGLLNPSPAFRLGCGKLGPAEIKAHPWFKGFDWNAFAAKTLLAPHVPKAPKHDADTVNFAQLPPAQIQLGNTDNAIGTAFADF